MKKIEIESIYPLSPMQQGMLFHSLFAPQSGVYLEQLTFLLQGEVDPAALDRAFQRLVTRYSVLRTSFVWKRLEQTVQVVHRRVHLPVEHLDWSDQQEAQQARRLAEYLKADRERGFDLAAAPLLRIAIIRLTENSYRLVWTHHHMLLDGWSMPVLLHDLAAYYNAEHTGTDISLPEPPAYRDYIAWLQKQDLSRAEEFWRSALAGLNAPTSLVGSLIQAPSLRERESLGSYADETLAFSPTETRALQAFARRHQLTLNGMVQAAWAMLLNRYSREEDVVFGATVSGRPPDLPGMERMVGLLINTLPVRVQIHPDQPVTDWLKTVQAWQTDAMAYAYSPLVKIQEWSDVKSGSPLFESLVVFENYPVQASMRMLDGVQIGELQSIEHTNYPVTLIASARDVLVLKLSFDQEQVEPSVARRVLGHLHTLVKGMIDNPQAPLSSLVLLTAAERQQILTDWNSTHREFPPAAYAQAFFEQQAAAHPDALALIAGEQRMTYADLNERANQLARYLGSQGVAKETLVGICTERSIEMIVAILGTLKAGGAFLPLDPTYPVDRLRFMLEDAAVPILLTQGHLLPHLPETSAQIVCMDRDWERISYEEAASFPCPSGPQNLAYVIYTSGSTGRPKGVLLEHGGLCNLIQTQVTQFRVDEYSRVLQFASFSFDAAVSEIFMALSSGASLVLAPHEILASPPDLARLIHAQQVSVVTLPPALLKVLDPLDFPGIRSLVSAGEACPLDVARRWAEGRHFFNGYGPTETTVQASCYQLEHLPAEARSLPIGKPVPNSQVYVLDPHLQPVPVGVPGELYVSGINLGRGYLNRPELTAERFLANPFETWTRARMYKTGDLVRWLPDGNLEYLGRTDHQVKIRGFRVELGEIENSLARCPGIRQVSVVARDSAAGDRQLVAYLVAEGDGDGRAPLKSADLRAYLRGSLPEYMLPAAFVFLDAFPLTPSGKVDRKALPDPNGGAEAEEIDLQPPRSPTEEILAHLWERLLGASLVGERSNFFDLGGHSIVATQLASRVRDAFGVELPLRVIFERPVLREMAQEIDRLRGRQADLTQPPLRPVERSAPIPLSFAQQRLWFLDQLEPGNPFYNLPACVRLTGRLDVVALQSSLSELSRRHESLRTNLCTDAQGVPWQVIHKDAQISLQVVELSGAEDLEEREEDALSQAKAETIRPFRLDQDPLLRAVLYRLDDTNAVLLLVMHHVIADAWSMGVLVDELTRLYSAAVSGSTVKIPELAIQYADYAVWQRNWLQGKALEEQLAYWKDKLAGLPPLLDLPSDRPRPSIQSYRGAIQQFKIDEALIPRLKTVCQKEGVTTYMLLLAVFQVLLNRYSGQEDFAVGTALANRERSELERLIGFFVNTLALRGDLRGAPSFREVLKRTRETCLEAYAHQDLPFEMLVDALESQRSLSHSPLFQVAFNFQTAPTPSFEDVDLSVSTIDAHNGHTSFDLLLTMAESSTGLLGTLEYCVDLFDAATIRRMTRHFQNLLASALADLDQPLQRLDLLSPDERQQILVDWNATQADYPSGRCAQHLFEEQARIHPDEPAVELDGERVNYRVLNERANQLAQRLQRQGVGVDSLVAVFTERSFDQVVAILGILKAGAAFLPLDPAYPRDRIAFMLSDSRASALLTQAHLADYLPAETPVRIVLDRDLAWDTADDRGDFPCPAGPDNLAYVIYTSGSTGRPKGAMLEHRGLCNLIAAQRRVFDVEAGKRILQFSSASFDASVWETFMALGNGATLVLARQEALASPPDLLRLLKTGRITHATLPPSVLQFLPDAELPDLGVLVVAGEACPAEIVARWGQGRRFFNAYGPTETTVCASMALCDPRSSRPPHIGRPIQNLRLYVLDQAQQPLPPGIPGELCVAGVGVGRGYLNRPELTAQRFSLDPFGAQPGGRLYHTGDRVRSYPDGNIEFLGRMDDQVKLHGFRIELGEIENVLLEQPGVRQAAVVVREDHLAAYLVCSEGDAPPISDDLRRGLRARLPEYMLPAWFVVLDALPLTPNGKIDRANLPDPKVLQSQERQQSGILAPRNPTEVALVEICQELLGAGQVSMTDNFFELGGHSLLATQFISRVRERMGVDLPLRALFEQPALADLAERITQIQADKPGAADFAPDEVLDTIHKVQAMSDEQIDAWLAKTSNLEGESGDEG